MTSSGSSLSSGSEEKRSKQHLISESSSSTIATQDEESWPLSEVIFIEDSKSSNILGKVVKVDADYVLVKMHHSKSHSSSNQTVDVQQQQNTALNDTELQAMSFLDNLRIFQKSQLQLIKSSSTSLSKLPDFMQKTPKKLADFGNVLCLAAQQSGIHAIVNKENAIFYVQYDLLSNKIVREKRFPSSLSFVGHQSISNIRLHTLDNPNVNLSFFFLFRICRPYL